ncbi:MAG: transposase [Rhodospirillaceae bacterium]|nr:transposase [Rhodospirillaceae bacterium]
MALSIDIIRRRTLANLSKMPPEIVAGFRAVLGGTIVMRVERSLPHGHVAAVLGTARALGLERILHRTRSRAGAVARLQARHRPGASATSSLGAFLGLGPVAGNEMRAMLDWLLKRQPWIERRLANRHLKGGNTLILYDVSSASIEGTRCALAAFGHNRDGKRGKRQITCGMLCASDGCPVAVEVFPGHASDPSTVSSQVDRVRRRLGIGRVGDRGMLTTARIREDLEPAGLDWISALKTVDIRRLLKEGAADGLPAHSLRTLLDNLATLMLNQMRLPGDSPLTVVTKPTPVQERAFGLLGVKPDSNVPIRMTGRTQVTAPESR